MQTEKAFIQKQLLVINKKSNKKQTQIKFTDSLNIIITSIRQEQIHYLGRLKIKMTEEGMKESKIK